MASLEIREYIMAFEPDKCRFCGALVSGMKVTDTHAQRPFPDVEFTFECGTVDWFSTWAGTIEGAREAKDAGVTGLHVGELPDMPQYHVYLRRVITQKGDCFARENARLKEQIVGMRERIDALEAEDSMSKERIRCFLRQQGITTFGPSEREI